MNLINKIKSNKKLAVILLLGIVSVVLLVISELFTYDAESPEENDSKTEIEYSYEEKIETKLSSMISQISGAGNSKVMVTLESSTESVYAVDQSINDDKSDSQYVLIKTGSTESGLLLKIITPEIRGVAVVCEGGASATVRQQITDMITSVLDISSNRVSVIKMK